MRNAWTIASREYRQYFQSPVAYIVAFLIMIVSGFLFFLLIYSVQQSSLNSYYPAPPPTAADVAISPAAFLLLFTAPALTMRLLSEEHRAGTLELLLTSPVKDWELVVGKWLGAMLYMLTIYAFTFIIPIVLNNFVTPGIDFGAAAAGYVGLILLTAAFLAIGTAFSSFINNSLAAFFGTLIMIFILYWIVGWPASLVPVAANVLNYLYARAHMNAMMDGVIALKDVIYFLSLTSLGLFLGTVAIEIRRWK